MVLSDFYRADGFLVADLDSDASDYPKSQHFTTYVHISAKIPSGRGGQLLSSIFGSNSYLHKIAFCINIKIWFLG
jgi:hypothetical protein